MALHFGKKGEYENKKIVGQLRRTQLVTTFGSGSIVDMPDYSVIIAATNYWKDQSPILHEPNLEKLLKVSYFKQPYVTENTEENKSPDIPAFRFPIMHFSSPFPPSRNALRCDTRREFRGCGICCPSQVHYTTKLSRPHSVGPLLLR